MMGSGGKMIDLQTKQNYFKIYPTSGNNNWILNYIWIVKVISHRR